ncbi:peptide chain release factor N(5)-glutamine methyltransferase [Treponema sp.]|uniref:peptide chain release factor N(5)-glutamine methyltransferase n=1 Tax=Treponema sp. TaxID=166 RepID=UPI0025D85BE1|nr:peptide chain release factor N(5)-glutamine methyltransferase [Treponema sp.]MCR5217373.1 peptide chain release factor N(5)-glutamine methyltransferase [Treponema sp.]
MTVAEAKVYGSKVLSQSPSPQLDVTVLLQEITGLDKTKLLFSRERLLSKEEEELYKDWLSKRQTGLPVAYITQKKEFYGYDFYVTPDVLIPKADTEILVEKALEILEEKINSKINQKILSICDMCCGSGCIALSVFKSALENKIITEENMPLFILADISSKALDVAKENSRRLLTEKQAQNIRFIQTNLFDQVNRNFDLILTNPPYIPSPLAKDLLKDGRSEPLLALDGDIDIEGNPTKENDGLGIIRNLLPQAYSHLEAGGALLCESGEYNAEETCRIFKETGLKECKIHKDLEGQLRVTEGFKSFSESF